MMFLFSFELEV